MADVLQYQEDSSVAGYNPDPQLVLSSSLTTLAGYIKTAIDNNAATLTTERLAGDANLQAQIDALSNDATLAERLAALSNLVNTLDLDNDSSIVDGLLTAKENAENALALATTAVDASGANSTAISALQSEVQANKATLTAFQSETTSRLGTLDTKVAEILAAIASFITAQEAWDLIAYNNGRIYAGLQAGLITFASVLGVTEPVISDEAPATTPTNSDII